jgi:hypothetical protein
MAVSTEIVRSWRGPGAAIRRQLAGGVTEGRALAYLMAGCGMIFVAQWPRLSREAFLRPEVPLDARLGAALLGWVFLAPLFFYGLAALSHLVARAFGGRGSWFGARLALFWTLLTTAPLFLLYGLVAGFLGPGPALNSAGLLLTVGFLGHWLLALAGAEARGAVEAGGERG